MISDFVKEICNIDELKKIQEELLYLKDYVPLRLFLTHEAFNRRAKFIYKECDDIVIKESAGNNTTHKSFFFMSYDEEGEIEYFGLEVTRFLLKYPKYKSILNEEGIKRNKVPRIPDDVFEELPHNDILNELSFLGWVYKEQEKLIKHEEYVPIFFFLTMESYEKRMKFLKENNLESILKRTKNSIEYYTHIDSFHFNEETEDFPFFYHRYNERVYFAFEIENFTEKNRQFGVFSRGIGTSYIKNDRFEPFGWGFMLCIGFLDSLCSPNYLMTIQDSLIELDTYVPIFLYITKESLKLRVEYLQKIKQEDIMEQYRESLNYFYNYLNLGEELFSFALEVKYFLKEYPEFKEIIKYETVDEYLKEKNLVGSEIPLYLDGWRHQPHVPLEELYPMEKFYIKK